MAETGASTVDFEKLVNDTDSRIASLEKQPSDIEAQMDTLKQKYEEAEKIKTVQAAIDYIIEQSK